MGMEYVTQQLACAVALLPLGSLELGIGVVVPVLYAHLGTMAHNVNSIVTVRQRVSTMDCVNRMVLVCVMLLILMVPIGLVRIVINVQQITLARGAMYFVMHNDTALAMAFAQR